MDKINMLQDYLTANEINFNTKIVVSDIKNDFNPHNNIALKNMMQPGKTTCFLL